MKIIYENGPVAITQSKGRTGCCGYSGPGCENLPTEKDEQESFQIKIGNEILYIDYSIKTKEVKGKITKQEAKIMNLTRIKIKDGKVISGYTGSQG